MKITGIVGTAKNTGKTTTLAALIEVACRGGAQRGETLGVTGIGYDGEEVDTVTGLPKPRLLLQPGTIVATSEDCLKNTSASFRVLKETSAQTALGRVVLVEIVTAGLMVLAGPNTKRSLEGSIKEMQALGVTRIFVDGSLNRLAAMSAVESVIFTTGASRSQSTALLASEARAIARIFSHPAHEAECLSEIETVAWCDKQGSAEAMLPARSLFDRDDADAALAVRPKDASLLFIPKMASLSALEHIVHRMHARGANARAFTIVLNDPTVLLLAGEPLLTERMLAGAAHEGSVDIHVLHPIPAAAMTVNPFYPLQHEHTFTPAYIDKDELLASVSRAVPVPVFNIKAPLAPEALFALL